MSVHRASDVAESDAGWPRRRATPLIPSDAMSATCSDGRFRRRRFSSSLVNISFVSEVVAACGTGRECGVCKPALADLVSEVCANSHGEKRDARFINDRVHANIQRDGTSSGVPRTRDYTRAVAQVDRTKLVEAVVAGTWVTAAVAAEAVRRDTPDSSGTTEPLIDFFAAAADALSAFADVIAGEAFLPSGRPRRPRRRRLD
jgi:hypothetical protein